MKKLFLLPLLAIMFCNAVAGQEVRKLPERSKRLKTDVMQAFEDRKSAALSEFTDNKISDQELSDLLFVANGVNRPESGKRTAPSALNSQEIDIYVCEADGVYRYDVAKHQLLRVTDQDIRHHINGRQANDAPTNILLVADISKFPQYNRVKDEMTSRKAEQPSEQMQRIVSMSSIDAGIVSQNIAIYCSAVGLKVRPRASMDVEAITEILGLSPTQIPWLNMPVSK